MNGTNNTAQNIGLNTVIEHSPVSALKDVWYFGWWFCFPNPELCMAAMFGIN
jgi:hypothetical protein